MLRLAAGVDIVKLTMQAALGWETEIGELPAISQVAYHFFYQQPESARRLTAIDGLDRLKAAPGGESADMPYPSGTEIDPGHGTRTCVFAVVGLAPDYAGVLAIEEFLQTGITAVYEHA